MKKAECNPQLFLSGYPSIAVVKAAQDRNRDQSARTHGGQRRFTWDRHVLVQFLMRMVGVVVLDKCFPNISYKENGHDDTFWIA